MSGKNIKQLCSEDNDEKRNCQSRPGLNVSKHVETDKSMPFLALYEEFYITNKPGDKNYLGKKKIFAL